VSFLYQGLWPRIIFPSDIANEQAALRSALESTNVDVQSCTALDPNEKTAWGLFYGTAIAFCDEEPGWLSSTGSMMNQAEKYEDELVLFQQKLAKTCKISAPNYAPPTAPDSITVALQYVAWTVGAIAGAYVVGKVVSVLPKPAPRAVVVRRR